MNFSEEEVVCWNCDKKIPGLYTKHGSIRCPSCNENVNLSCGEKTILQKLNKVIELLEEKNGKDN